MLTGPICFLPMAGDGLQDTIYALYHVSVIGLEINFCLLKPIVTAVMTSETSLCVVTKLSFQRMKSDTPTDSHIKNKSK
jgi:hypothetical protein